MEMENQLESTAPKSMLPPPPGTFQDREELIKYVRDFGASQGYVVTIKKSRRDRRVILGCDRGGVYRNRRKIDEKQRKRKACSRLINCPFEAVGKKEDDVWLLTIKNGDHNHEPLKDMSEHPCSHRFTEEEVKQIKLMTEAGVKPRQVLKALKQTNPDLQSTPRHLYNLKAKIHQGNLSGKSFKLWKPNRSIPVNSCAESSVKHKNPLKVPNYIGGKFVESQSSATIDVINPATQEVVSHVPLTTYEEFKAAVSAAKSAFPSWKNTPATTRQRIMFKLQELIRRDIDKLAMTISIEQGITLNGAKDDLLHSLEVVEHACSIATLQMGEFVPNASSGIDTFCIREPLGVCAGICPNFPIFPIAVACGNTFILKPSEKNPGVSIALAALAAEAGLPDGVLNIVHGTDVIVNNICDDDDIKAVSFVGSNATGLRIYARAAARGKHVQYNVGVKNHAIILPDASADATLDALIASAFGAAGQICMNLTTSVFVGGSAPWERELVEHAKMLKVNAGIECGADLGPVISKEVKDQICRLVQSGVESGARLVLDGRNIVVPGYEQGNFVGPTILCDVTNSMECYKEEMFGPVLLCMQADSLDEAIAIVNKNRYASGASIFTMSGVAARKFQNEVEADLVGINVPVPMPLPFSLSDGSKPSFYGDLSFCGKAGVQFYTKTKTVAQQWKDLPSRRVSLPLPPTSETEISSQGMSLMQPPTSESDLPSREISPAMCSTSGKDLPTDVSLPMPSAAEQDPQNVEAYPSRLPTSDRELPQCDGSVAMPSTSEKDLVSRGVSIVVPSTDAVESRDQGRASLAPPLAEMMYLPQTSQWMSIAPNSQRIDTTAQSINAAAVVASERLFIPTSSVKKSMNTMSLKNELQKEDIVMLPAAERIYLPHVSHHSNSVGLTCQRAETTMNVKQDMMYMPSSQRNDGFGLVSSRTNSSMNLGSGRLYTPPSYTANVVLPPRASAMPQTCDKIYLPSAVQRNDNSDSNSVRLFIASNPQGMYSHNSMTSRDDCCGQGLSSTLPTSH